MNNKYWYVLLVPILFIVLIWSVNYFVIDNRDNKYCDLGRMIDKQTAELNPVFYDMEKQAESYLGGKSITGKTNGKLLKWAGDFSSYTCSFEYTIQVGNITQTVSVLHNFNGNELVDWRATK